MKNSEIIDLTNQELADKIAEEKANIIKLKINHKVSDLDNPKVISKTKKLVARLKTEQRKRELEQQSK